MSNAVLRLFVKSIQDLGNHPQNEHNRQQMMVMMMMAN